MVVGLQGSLVPFISCHSLVFLFPEPLVHPGAWRRGRRSSRWRGRWVGSQSDRSRSQASTQRTFSQSDSPGGLVGSKGEILSP